MQSRKGFTMVELLVVLIILGILVAVATPMYFANTNRARASEAVAAMGVVRQGLRDNFVRTNSYFDILAGNIDNQLPPASPPGVNVNLGVAQYFSNNAYSVDAGAAVWATGVPSGSPTAPVDFLITVDGSQSVACGVTGIDCAVRRAEILTYRLQMDNSGRTFVSYNDGSNWEAY